MRTLLTRVALALFLVVTFTNGAWANGITPFAVGTLTYHETPVPGQASIGQFTIENMTGPGFQVVTPLSFFDVFLDVQQVGVIIDAGLNLNANGDGFLSDFFSVPGPGDCGEPLCAPNGATFTGNMGFGMFMDNLGDQWSIMTAIYHAALSGGGPGIAAGPLVDGDSATLYIDAAQAPPQIPEPATLMLFGTGVIGLAATYRRRTAKK